MIDEPDLILNSQHLAINWILIQVSTGSMDMAQVNPMAEMAPEVVLLYSRSLVSNVHKHMPNLSMHLQPIQYTLNQIQF